MRSYFSNFNLHFVTGVTKNIKFIQHYLFVKPAGILFAVSGPFEPFLRFPILVGMGGPYRFFLSFNLWFNILKII